MPIKTSPKKIKLVTYVTSIEHAQAMETARLQQLSLSEWLRALIIGAFAKVVVIPAQVNQPYVKLPDATQLRNDLIFGDVNEPHNESGDE